MYMYIISDLHSQAPLWVLLPQELLWDQFCPIESHIRENIYSTYLCYCKNSGHNSKCYTYNFSFWSFESLWSFFSSIALETSDETHTAIHWSDQSSNLAINYYKTVLFKVCYKQCKTHCLSNDANDARLASEPRQTLETKYEVKGNIHFNICMSDHVIKVAYSVSDRSHCAL